MELILVRHALPVRRENSDGPADPELSPEGIEQARHFAGYMHLEHIDAIYSSPMRRAVQTAEPLAALKNLGVTLVPGVAEFDQNANDPRWKEMVEGGWNSDEDRHAFHERVIGSIDSIIDDHPGGRVLVTCHGGVINEYLAHVLGLPGGHFFYPNYTSIHRIAASSKGHRSILSVNESGHLRGTGLPIGLFHG